jgi:hypothetical protein
MLPTQDSLNQPIKYDRRRSISPSIRERMDDVDSVIDDDDDDDAKYYFDIRNQPDNNDTKIQGKPYVNTHPTYNYRALESLTKNMDEITGVDYLVLCPYSVNTEGDTPFLQFGLIHDGLSLNFITIPWTESSIDLEKLNNLHGHIVQNRTMYLFLEYCTDNEKMFLTMFPILTFVLVDEIMNQRIIYRTAISINVFDFFTKNENFLYLENAKGKIYETPIVAYRGTYKENVNFMSMFGVACSQPDAIMGPYYYFTDYINAMKQGIMPTKEHVSNPYFKKYLTADNKYRNGAVLRFALFLGITKVILNRPSDNIDESQTKKLLLSNQETSGMARNTMRMSDHDASWTNMYNSVYIGKIVLDDGSMYLDAPLWVLKEYNQQVFLSYHMIDRQKSLFL